MLCSNKFGFYQIPFVLCTVVVAVLDIPGHGGHLTKKKQKERKIKLRAKYPIEIISMQLFNPRKKVQILSTFTVFQSIPPTHI
jgi:hypothetical protein